MTRNATLIKELETDNRERSTADCEYRAPTDNQIRVRAHEIYQARCATGSGGDELTDWTAAECELRDGRNGDQVPTEHGAEPSAGRQRRHPADPTVRRDARQDVAP